MRRCLHCNEQGHIKRLCPQLLNPSNTNSNNSKYSNSGGGGAPCQICASRQHRSQQCPTGLCFNCFRVGHRMDECVKERRGTSINSSCRICNLRGSHPDHSCPDHWRRYKWSLTAAQQAPNQKSKQNNQDDIDDDVFCYMCGGGGHVGDECREQHQRQRPQNWRSVSGSLSCHATDHLLRRRGYDGLLFWSRSANKRASPSKKSYTSKPAEPSYYPKSNDNNNSKNKNEKSSFSPNSIKQHREDKQGMRELEDEDVGRKRVKLDDFTGDDERPSNYDGFSSDIYGDIDFTAPIGDKSSVGTLQTKQHQPSYHQQDSNDNSSQFQYPPPVQQQQQQSPNYHHQQPQAMMMMYPPPSYAQPPPMSMYNSGLSIPPPPHNPHQTSYHEMGQPPAMLPHPQISFAQSNSPPQFGYHQPHHLQHQSSSGNGNGGGGYYQSSNYTPSYQPQMQRQYDHGPSDNDGRTSPHMAYGYVPKGRGQRGGRGGNRGNRGSRR